MSRQKQETRHKGKDAKMVCHLLSKGVQHSSSSPRAHHSRQPPASQPARPPEEDTQPSRASLRSQPNWCWCRAVSSPLLSHPQPTQQCPPPPLPHDLRRAAQQILLGHEDAATHISSSAPLPPSSLWIGIHSWMMMAGSCAAAPVAGLPSLRTPPPTHLRLGGFFPCSSAARSPGGPVLGCALVPKKQTAGVARLNRVLASCR